MGSQEPDTTPLNTSRVATPRIGIAVVREGGKPCRRDVVVDGEIVRIGSNASNDVALDDSTVSRFHCRIERTPRGWTLEDTGSLNGTRLLGVSIQKADLAFPVTRIDIGASTLEVRELGSETSDELSPGVSCGALYGQSPAMRRLFHAIRRIGATDTTVLIEGETGTGKEVVANELVQRSPRRGKPLVIVDCSAIPQTLMESELFGHARGAFTGAHATRVGAFEAANGGTVFLDELGELPLAMQPKLLRVLAERRIRRVGDNEPREVDVRVIAATNRQLEAEVNAGRFREDLFYRLAVARLRIPPLRDRREDIPLLADYFLSQMNASHQRAAILTPELLAEMARHPWPGNVRELRNYVERALLGETGILDAEQTCLAPSLPPPAETFQIDVEVPYKAAKDKLVGRFERAYLAAVLAWADGNVSKAARKAGLDRMHVHRLMQRHRLVRPGDIGDDRSDD